MLRAIILIAVFAAVKGDGCIPLSFGEKGNVCICNSTYCDTIEMPQLQTDQFLWYISTKDGKMMEYSINNFSNEDEIKNKSERIKVLTIDSSLKYQQIFGFGGAMTDAAALNIRTLSNETQHKLLESYFGSTGIGYTYCRLPIAGTDFSTRPYTYDDVPGDITLSNFSLVEEDDYKIEYLHHIESIMPDSDNLKILTTSWSAPPWMKNTNNIKWGTLKSEYKQLYANYIKKFFDAYKERGIKIWGITPGNEPLDGLIPFFPFNAMLWMPTEEAEWSVNYLAPTLSEYKDLLYIAMDDQRFELPWYPDIMFQNQKAKELFSGIAVHWYADQIFSPDRITITHNKYPDKFLIMTEACTGSTGTDPFGPKVDLGSWKRGEEYIEDIIENLLHWVSGWIDWNLALNESGGPNWAQNNVDSPIIVIPQKDQFYKQPMFYAISHFSKFVTRGSYRIFSREETSSFDQNNTTESIAFLTPEQKIIVVIVNKNDEPVALTIKNKIESKIININLPAKSFHTISYLAEQ
ncbi:lysosomal acid glucosylceramidase-like isoform X2 [Cataglyphis hispanica]|nr:lysosomal acid glucosylceramidase-like isoform X2 [Cataglyphis hispanica]